MSILIISENNDYSTRKVISHLKSDYDFRVISPLTLDTLSLNDIINVLHESKAIWTRRGLLVLQKNINNIESYKIIKDYLYHIAESDRKCLGSISQELYHNKLIDLHLAKKFNIKTPNWRLIELKEEITSFLNSTNSKKIITKAIEDITKNKNDDNITIMGNPKIIDLNDIPNGKLKTSFVQEFIEKDFDIRSFYLNGQFYSMAIMSQTNNDTHIDYRSNTNKYVRMMPYKIDDQTKIKLDQMLKYKELNCCSIDLISFERSIFFIEINPIGQFDFLNYHCNYNIEERIAHHLMTIHDEK